MAIIVICPSCNEENPGSSLQCVKCQANLVGVPRQIKPPTDAEIAAQEHENQPAPPQLQTPVSMAVPLRPQKSNRSIGVIVGIAAAFICLCSILCMAAFGTSLYKVYTEKAPIEAVLDTYMRHMANKDAESAYALFSPRAQRQLPISKLQELLEGKNYFIFEGYQSLSVNNLNITAGANTNPNVPQGTVAKVTGVVVYDGDIQGTFNGILEKVGDEWMIYGMNNTVPPSKIK